MSTRDRRRVRRPASTATLRRILARARSSCRTPASRVYSPAIAPSASSATLTSSAVSPARSSCRGQQVVPGDGDLLVLGVAVQRDQLHPVQQRAGDGVHHVGGGQEQHVGQVEVDLQVVVAEGVVLRRVEHLQQGGGRVAGVAGGQLVDLVEQHDRVHRAGLAHRPDDPAGQRADVGAPVAADLGLVADAAERDPDELAARAPARRTRRGWSCRPREGRPGRAPRRSRDRRPRCRLRARRAGCAPPGTPGCGPSRRPGRRGRRRAPPGPRPGRCCPRYACSTASPARCPARCGSSPPPGRRRWPAPACRPRAWPPRGPSPAGRRPRPGTGSRPEPSGSSSPSSLRIAASCWRSRNSRWDFSSPSRTSLLIFSVTSCSARWSFTQPTSSSSRAVTSGAASSSVFCSRVSQGA